MASIGVLDTLMEDSNPLQDFKEDETGENVFEEQVIKMRLSRKAKLGQLTRRKNIIKELM